MPSVPILNQRRWVRLASLSTVLMGAALTLGESAAFVDIAPTGAELAGLSRTSLWAALTGPALVLLAGVAWLLPGALAALALGGHSSLGGWLLAATALSWAFQVVLSAILLALVEPPVSPVWILRGFTVMSVLLLCVLYGRAGSSRAARIELVPGDALRDQAAVLLLLGWAVLVSLAPYLWIQDATGDGIEMVEMGRSLRWYPLPRNFAEEGLLGLGAGVLPMSYPVQWFQAILGDGMISARGPIGLYAMLLCAGVTAIVEAPQRDRRLARADLLLVAAGVASVVWTLARNASYYPYFADVGSPTAIELFTTVAMLGMLYFGVRLALAEGRGAHATGWFVGFTVLLLFCRPTGLLLFVLLVAGACLAWPTAIRGLLRAAVLALVGFFALAFLYQSVYIPSVAPPGSMNFGTGSVVERFYFLTLTSPERLAWGIVPAGIVPCAFFALGKRISGVSLAAALMWLGYLAVFAVPAFVSLHHFVPVMVLPLVGFWASELPRSHTTRWRIGLAAGLVASFALGTPATSQVSTLWQELGTRTVIVPGRFDASAAEYRQATGAIPLGMELFPRLYMVDSPEEELVHSPAQLWFYARHHDGSLTPEDLAEVDYLYLPPGEEGPPGFNLAGTTEAGSAWVRDVDAWQRQRAQPLSTDFRAPLYAIPDEVLFPHMGRPKLAFDLYIGHLLKPLAE